MKLKFLIFIFIVFAQSCGGVATPTGAGGNPATPVPPLPVFGDIRLRVAASQSTTSTAVSTPVLNSVSLVTDQIRIEESRHVISDISFEQEGGTEAEIEFPDVYVAVIVQDGNPQTLSYPSFDTVSLPAGTYNEIEFKIEKYEETSLPTDLLEDPLSQIYLSENSFVIEGSFLESDTQNLNSNSGQDFIPFRIVSDKNASIRLRSNTGFTIASGATQYFFLTFKIETWVANLLPLLQDLQTSDLESGTAQIDDTSSSSRIRDILEQFETNVETSCRSAPSEDENFDESDVDEDSSSSSF